MFTCITGKIKQILKNLTLYIYCFMNPGFFIYFFLFTFISSIMFYNYPKVVFIILVSFIFFLINFFVSGSFLYNHDIEEDLKKFEDKLKENFKSVVGEDFEEFVALHYDVKKCNKPFEKKILKAKIILIGLSYTHFTISKCTEFNLLNPVREDIKKFCALANKCEFKEMEDFYYTFVEKVFYNDDKLFIVTSNIGSKVIECDEASAKNAVKAIRKRLREREERRQYYYLKEAV